MNPDDKLIARLRALLAKTTENGCTESEAMMAAEKAAEIMAQHRVTMTDVEIGQEPVGKMTLEAGGVKRRHVAWFASFGIGRYTGTKVWGHNKTQIIFFGLYHDTVFAKHLYLLCRDSIDRAVSEYQRTDSYRCLAGIGPKRDATRAFGLAMASRINHRLVDLARSNEPTLKTATGTALVPVRNALVGSAFAKLDVHLRASRESRTIHNSSAAAAGRAAGDRVQFNRAMGADTGSARIGNR